MSEFPALRYSQSIYTEFDDRWGSGCGDFEHFEIIAVGCALCAL